MSQVRILSPRPRICLINHVQCVIGSEIRRRTGITDSRTTAIIFSIAFVGRDEASERSRKQTGDRLRAGSVPVTEIRAGVIVGPGSAAYEVIRDLVYHLPLMVTPRWVRSKSSRALAYRKHAGHGHRVLASARRLGPAVLGDTGSVPLFIFKGMTRAIACRAETLEASRAGLAET
jgi:hypothetical protein